MAGEFDPAVLWYCGNYLVVAGFTGFTGFGGSAWGATGVQRKSLKGVGRRCFHV
jgi:hypothetical protein